MATEEGRGQAMEPSWLGPVAGLEGDGPAGISS